MAGPRVMTGVLVAAAAVAAAGATVVRPAPGDEIAVVVAARDLNPGVLITAEDLYGLQLPPALVADGMFVAPVHVVGRVAHERILANEIVRSERLADPASGVGLQAVLPEDKRAISVAVGSVFPGLKPGNRVDLRVTRPGSEPEWLFGDAITLGVVEGPPAVIKLIVTAEQAEQLVRAEREGELSVDLSLWAVNSGLQLPPRWLLAPEQAVVRDQEPDGWCQEFVVILGGEKRTVLVDAYGIPCDPRDPPALRR